MKRPIFIRIQIINTHIIWSLTVNIQQFPIGIPQFQMVGGQIALTINQIKYTAQIIGEGIAVRVIGIIPIQETESGIIGCRLINHGSGGFIQCSQQRTHGNRIDIHTVLTYCLIIQNPLFGFPIDIHQDFLRYNFTIGIFDLIYQQVIAFYKGKLQYLCRTIRIFLTRSSQIRQIIM